MPFYKIGTFGGEPDAFISRKLFDEYKTKYPYPHKGDILISASGSIGRTIEFTGKDEYFQDSNIVWLKHENEIDNNFLKVLYSIVEWSCEGSTIKRLYNDNFLKTEFMLPQIDEQIKLGDYFANLDNLITLHRRAYYNKKGGLTNVHNDNQQWDYKNHTGFLPTKNKSSIRKIPLDWQTVMQFAELVKRLPEDEPIFVNGKIYNSTINSVLARHCKEVDIPIISIHGLRHTHASLLLFAGVSIASVARRLGHSNITTTQKTYLHIIQELESKDIDLIMRALSNLN